MSVPTYGVILLNSTLDKVLLVQSYKRKKWGFPKGKVNENESGEVCAAREAQEEIGFNVDSLLDPDTWLEQVCMSIFFVVSVCLINRLDWKYFFVGLFATNKQPNKIIN